MNTLKNKTIQMLFVPSFYFSTSLTKNTIDEYISILMAEIGVNVFGYNRLNDEYWGNIKTNKNNNIKFTMIFKKPIYENTIICVSIFNVTPQESDKIAFKFCETIKVFENSPSIYKKKYNIQ